MAVDIHLFMNRDGIPSASITDSQCVRSKFVLLAHDEMVMLTQLMHRIAGAGPADGKDEEGDPC
jgi:hypothetical protein